MTSPVPLPLETLSLRHRERFLVGRRLFNRRAFWEAHEAWEDVWKETQDPERRLLQGLIQAAAAYHLLVTTPRIGGALRNIEKSLDKLDAMPDECLGVRIDELRTTLRRAHAEARRLGRENLPDLRSECIPAL